MKSLDGMSAIVSDHIFAGGPGDFMTVRHLVMRGGQVDIGAALGRLAIEELGVVKPAPADHRASRAQRHFMQRNWPEHHLRMQGAASAFEAELETDGRDFSFLAYDIGFSGCSCVFHPGSTTEDGHNLLARNFDWSTGSAADVPLGSGAAATFVADFTERPTCGRPFLLETYPDEGYPSIGMCAFELLGTLTDGVNSHGLAYAK